MHCWIENWIISPPYIGLPAGTTTYREGKKRRELLPVLPRRWLRLDKRRGAADSSGPRPATSHVSYSQRSSTSCCLLVRNPLGTHRRPLHEPTSVFRTLLRQQKNITRREGVLLRKVYHCTKPLHLLPSPLLSGRIHDFGGQVERRICKNRGAQECGVGCGGGMEYGASSSTLGEVSENFC